VTLLSPSGLLIALAIALPFAALILALRRVERVRTGLRLPPERRGATRAHAAALAATVALLALAAAQPARTSTETRRVRTDAEAFIVVDVSRSMRAARPGGPSRLTRARTEALELVQRLRDVPLGVATLTDRVLPNLFPTPDDSAVTQTLRRAVSAEQPPPREVGVRATTLAALGEAAGANLFAARRKALVVLTDGETRPYGEAATARRLRSARVSLVLVHVWRPDERLEPGYRPDPASREALAALADATGGVVRSEGDVAAVAAAVHAALGDGPTAPRGVEEHTMPLAPWVALAALVPLGLVLRRRNIG
jgi:hypothetical protein